MNPMDSKPLKPISPRRRLMASRANFLFDQMREHVSGAAYQVSGEKQSPVPPPVGDRELPPSDRS